MSAPDLGLYVHWPYCAAICPYCDFNVYRSRGEDRGALIDAIAADLAAHAARFGKREAVSLFFGGGTPSLLRGAELARLIEAADRAFGLGSDCEITLEANPEDLALFAEHAAAGVNRFSVGVQALDDAALKALGRWHDAACAVEAVEAAAATGKRVSLDLIYAREGQSLPAWRAELQQALALPTEHVSLYQLTIEPDTAFARRVARGELKPPDNETAARFYEATQELCDAAGFPAYEISNHARSDAARSRHNALYWRSQDWVGVGPGAHGRITQGGARIALEAARRPAEYVAAVTQRGIGAASEEALSGEAIADEMLIMGLRIGEGVDRAAFERLRGRPIQQRALDLLLGEGLIALADGRIRVTPRGRVLTNAIAAELAA
ncbi:MAG: coproporphyrinogen III oxidase [Hyphomonadaceae bacterium]|nr:coproporphyrinogen III oxidase [Hyphomonadaceae bacterium]